MQYKNVSSLHITPTEAGALGGFFSSQEYQDHISKEQYDSSIRKKSKPKLKGSKTKEVKRRYNRVDRYQILRFIKSWIDVYGEAPSLWKIAEYNGLSGPHHSKYIALRLEEDGYIKYHRGVKRGIELLKLSDPVKTMKLKEVIDG